MAFINEKSGPKAKFNSEENLWALKQGSDQYEAWWAWMYEVFRRKTRPKALTTLYEWPPTTPHGAAAVASWLSKIRDDIDGDPVPRHPAPWSGEIPQREQVAA